MMIIDAHQDIAFNAWAIKRDFFESALAKRAREVAADPTQEDLCTVGLPELQAANVGMVIASIFVETARAAGGPGSHSEFSYSSPAEARSQALMQLEYYHKITADPRLLAIQTRDDLEDLLRRRSKDPVLGLMIEMEGADAILAPSDVAEWYQAGVRQIGLAWAFANRYCGGNREPGPLTADGVVLLREMERLGMFLDISHLAEESFWQALAVFNGPVLASHNGCRALVPGERQITDKMIRAIIERDGVIGIVFYNAFLKDGWESSQGKQAVPLAGLIQHIDRICQLAGNADHVGIGSDLDGGLGANEIPAEMDTAADLALLAPALTAAGYATADVEKIMGGNWLRFLRRNLPAKA